jgi:hypothetical protein
MDPEMLTRRFVDAYNSRQLEAQIELFDPDIELVPLRATLEDTVYRGHDGIRQFVRDIDELWSEANTPTCDPDGRPHRGPPRGGTHQAPATASEARASGRHPDAGVNSSVDLHARRDPEPPGHVLARVQAPDASP